MDYYPDVCYFSDIGKMNNHTENRPSGPYTGHHYSQKIYKKNNRKFPFFWLGIIVFFAAALVLFKFMAPHRDEYEPEETPAQSYQVEAHESYSDSKEATEEDDFKLSDDELPFPHLRNKKEERRSAEETPPDSEESNPPLRKHREKKAREYVRKHEYEKALAVYIKLSENDRSYLAEAGICCYQLERYEQAAEYLEDALAYHSDDIKVRKYLAWSYYKLDNIEKARFHAEEGLKLGEDRELMALKQRISKEETLMDDYSYVEKVNFKIRFSQTEHREIETIVSGILDDAYREIGNQINYYPPGSVTVILYNEKNFFDITRSPSWAGGLYDGKIHVPIGGYTGDEVLLKSILYHEYVHSLVHSLTTKCPVWLNEGLAEYFSRIDRDTIGQKIPLKYLSAAFRSSKIEIIYVAYLQSFSVVYDMVNRYGMYRLKDLLFAMKDGTSFEKAFRDVFFMSFSQFANTWGK